MSNSQSVSEIPRGNARGFVKYFARDFLAGFLVFLIALPLCLGISIASGFPPIAGVLTAVVGAILTSLISNSELTIKGPAAGLIVIVVGAVTEFKDFVPAGIGADEAMFAAYRMALAVGLVAGLFQIVFGIFKLGILGEFFPTSVVHGMLAAIGVIIISKQVHVALGVMNVKGDPLELLTQIPHSLFSMNPEIACIGFVSLALLFGMPFIKHKGLKRIPTQMVVIILAIPMGIYFDLPSTHTYTFAGHEFELSEKFLVTVPSNLLKALAYPDFSILTHPVAWKWVVMFTLIGTLESLLSAKAIESLDPWKRKTNFNRDLLAVGAANMASAAIGGLPMISEIVRSKANIDNGARTRFADFWHGIFLLLFVALVPGLIHRIPLAALAAMLVYTGFRLASPNEFLHVYHMGREQLLIFVGTLIGVLATDLLVGVFIGIGIKLGIHVLNGVPVRSLFKTYLDVENIDDTTCIIRARESAVFSNWIPFKRQIEHLGLVQRRHVIVDLSDTQLVDHSVMGKLHGLQDDFENEGLTLELIGLDVHRPLAHHEYSARKRGLPPMRRITALADFRAQDQLLQAFMMNGASVVNVVLCSAVIKSESIRRERCRLETVVNAKACDDIIVALQRAPFKQFSVEINLEHITAIVLDAEVHQSALL